MPRCSVDAGPGPGSGGSFVAVPISTVGVGTALLAEAGNAATAEVSVDEGTGVVALTLHQRLSS